MCGPKQLYKRSSARRTPALPPTGEEAPRPAARVEYHTVDWGKASRIGEGVELQEERVQEEREQGHTSKNVPARCGAVGATQRRLAQCASQHGQLAALSDTPAAHRRGARV